MFSHNLTSLATKTAPVLNMLTNFYILVLILAYLSGWEAVSRVVLIYFSLNITDIHHFLYAWFYEYAFFPLLLSV